MFTTFTNAKFGNVQYETDLDIFNEYESSPKHRTKGGCAHDDAVSFNATPGATPLLSRFMHSFHGEYGWQTAAKLAPNFASRDDMRVERKHGTELSQLAKLSVSCGDTQFRVRQHS